MPESVQLRMLAPYDFAIDHCGTARSYRVNDAVDVPVAVVDAAEAPVAISVDTFQYKEVPFRVRDGRMFRPFLLDSCDQGGRMAAANAADKAMTLALLNGRPRVLALDAWDAEYRTPLLGSPFKRAPWPDNQGAVPSASKRRMSKAVLKDGRDEAFAKARALGPRMMVVDGVAYHETRLPCWKIGPSRPEALITDLGTPVHHVLVDPRYDFAEIARVLGREANAKSNAIRILRPELVDGCVEVDAAGSVAMAFVANQKAYVGEIERSLFALCLRMVDAAERASVADDPSSALAAFHGCIEELASYRPSDESWSKCPGMVDRAKTYLAAHAAFPPIRNLAETDDLDAIAGLRP